MGVGVLEAHPGGQVVESALVDRGLDHVGGRQVEPEMGRQGVAVAGDEEHEGVGRGGEDARLVQPAPLIDQEFNQPFRLVDRMRAHVGCAVPGGKTDVVGVRVKADDRNARPPQAADRAQAGQAHIQHEGGRLRDRSRGRRR